MTTDLITEAERMEHWEQVLRIDNETMNGRIKSVMAKLPCVGTAGDA